MVPLVVIGVHVYILSLEYVTFLRELLAVIVRFAYSQAWVCCIRLLVLLCLHLAS